MFCRGQCGGADISIALNNATTDDAAACPRHIYGCSTKSYDV
jgi:hypothetical protein